MGKQAETGPAFAAGFASSQPPTVGLLKPAKGLKAPHSSSDEGT